MFTGKAKERFENYIHSHYTHEDVEGLDEWWDAFPMSMKWGVIQEFGDSLGYIIEDKIELSEDETEFETLSYSFIIAVRTHLNYFTFSYAPTYTTRKDARTEAINKLNELINNGI